MRRRHERIPAEARDTIRRRILEELRKGTLSSRDLSMLVGIPEKDVANHLGHLHTTLKRSGAGLTVQPAECMHCGFVFEKRDRFTTPGKCPVCRSESIHAPLFSVPGK